MGTKNNKPVLVQIMAWCQSGDKLSELTMAYFTDAYFHHQASMDQRPLYKIANFLNCLSKMLFPRRPAWF